MATTLDDFPARRTTTGPKPRPARTTTGVRLGPVEEAANRFGYRTPAEIDADWAAYDAYQAAMSRWIDGRGPHPDSL
jgi:hypothetical protein